MTNKIPEITIGVPSHEVGRGLSIALQSVYKQSYFKFIAKVLLIVDGNKLTSEILSSIENPKLTILYNTKQLGQSASINKIIHNTSTELLILTNDDVVLEYDTVEKLVDCYQFTSVGLLAGCVIPMKPSSIMENILLVGNKLTHKIRKSWNKGDNFLACNGRLIGLSKKLYQEISLPDNIWNNDLFIYLQSKIHGFKFSYSEDSICYYRNPTSIVEYTNQSIRFQSSNIEIKLLKQKELTKFCRIPLKNNLYGFFLEFMTSPLYTSIYFFFFLYLRLAAIFQKKHIYKKNYWDTDISTKII